MTQRRVKIGFIGAGSIGSLFGGYLASLKSDEYSTEVILFCRESHANEINKNGLILKRGQSELKITELKAYKNPKEADDLLLKDSDFSFDFLFLTTKAYDLETAMVEYRRVIESSKWIIILQNGIGNEQIAYNYCPEKKILRMLTSGGALLSKAGEVIHTGEGITKLGFPIQKGITVNGPEMSEIQVNLKLISDLLNLVGIDTEIVDDIIGESWEKVFVNVGINAFGALSRLKNGQLLENKGIKHMMGIAINEALKVAEKQHIILSNKDFLAVTYDVAKNTAENKNSMLQDILKRKPTEIDFINGRIVKLGKELGVNTPVNELLTYLIKGLEESGI